MVAIKPWALTFLLSVAWLLPTPGAAQTAGPREAFDQALKLQAEQRQDEAVRMWTKLINSGQLRKKNLALAYFNRAAAQQSLGKGDQALADYGRALETDPAFAEAYLAKGNLWREKKEYKRAIYNYGQALKLDRSMATAHHNRGVAHLATGELDLALRDFDQALELDPESARTYNSRGNLWEARGELKLAEMDYDRALRLDPEYPSPYYNRSLLRERQGRLTEALADAQEFARLLPDHPMAASRVAALKARLAQP